MRVDVRGGTFPSPAVEVLELNLQLLYVLPI